MPSAPKAPAPPPPPKSPDINVGDMVMERYRVDEQIGIGGHSFVFKGTDERLSRPVCIKIFSGFGGDSGVGRTSYEHFVQEAFALSRLTHPNTLRIYDFGHLGPKDSAGMPLQVCEYMNGGTLSNIVREQGKQTLEETVRVIGAMCSALSEAHQLGIVHRDIKPQNILFGSVGHNRLPKLADFGIAKWSTETQDTKQDKRAEDTAIVAGQKLAMYSPSWAAPEQLAGQPVSPATDIYSLAVVAIYMLSGKAIFADEDVYVGYKKRRQSEDLVRETLVPLNLPRPVIDVLSRALAFDPKKRLVRIDELSNELHQALEPATEEQPRGSPPKPKSTSPMPAATAETAAPTTPAKRTSKLTPASTIPGIKPGGATDAKKPVAPKTGEQPAVEPPVAGSPTPPVIPAVDPTPQLFHAPPSSQVWMHMMPGPAPSSTVHRLPLADPQQIGDRHVQFTMIGDNSADLAGLHGTKVRVTLMPSPTGQRVVHVKGMTCFVAHLGGRPSPAVNLDRSSDLSLVTPRAQEIGYLRIAFGSPQPGQVVFNLGSELVAVGTEDCADPIQFDFGPGSEVYFVYTRGRTLPKPSRRG